MQVYSIFRSIDGEVNCFGQGSWSTFIRLAGCNLDCLYCDTRYARGEFAGKEVSVREVVDNVVKLKCDKITITGGEPMLQPASVFNLTRELSHLGCRISVETNGSMELAGYVDCWVVDYKLPFSGMCHMMDPNVFHKLRPSDFVKFVVSNENDFDWGVRVREEMRQKGCRARFAWSPNVSLFGVKEVLGLMQKHELFNDILNVQIHKLLNLQEDF